MGMVSFPLMTTFVTAAPITIPSIVLPMMAGKAAPPRTYRPTPFPISVTRLIIPLPIITAAKSTRK